MATLTDALVLELRKAVMDNGANPALGYNDIKRIWSRAGGDFDTALAIYARQLALYHVQCGNKDMAIEYRKMAEELAASTGLGLGTISVGYAKMNLNYPTDDDDSADRLDWEV